MLDEAIDALEKKCQATAPELVVEIQELRKLASISQLPFSIIALPRADSDPGATWNAEESSASTAAPHDGEHRYEDLGRSGLAKKKPSGDSSARPTTHRPRPGRR